MKSKANTGIPSLGNLVIQHTWSVANGHPEGGVPYDNRD